MQICGQYAQNSVFDLEWVENVSKVNSLNGRARPPGAPSCPRPAFWRSPSCISCFRNLNHLRLRSGSQTEMAKEWGQGNEVQLRTFETIPLPPFPCQQKPAMPMHPHLGPHGQSGVGPAVQPHLISRESNLLDSLALSRPNQRRRRSSPSMPRDPSRTAVGSGTFVAPGVSVSSGPAPNVFCTKSNVYGPVIELPTISPACQLPSESRKMASGVNASTPKFLRFRLVCQHDRAIVPP